MASLGSLAIDLSANTATLSSDMARAEGVVSKAVADINVTINKIGSGANFRRRGWRVRRWPRHGWRAPVDGAC